MSNRLHPPQHVPGPLGTPDLVAADVGVTDTAELAVRGVVPVRGRKGKRGRKEVSAVG